MLNSRQLQSLYNDLYVQIRKYVWPISTIEILADFEIACYRAFPDMREVLNIFNKLNIDMCSTYQGDEDFMAAVEAMKNFIVDNQDCEPTDVYYKLNRVREVV